MVVPTYLVIFMEVAALDIMAQDKAVAAAEQPLNTLLV
jgi:hypothetical protein